jgi:hypothetical protein
MDFLTETLYIYVMRVRTFSLAALAKDKARIDKSKDKSTKAAGSKPADAGKKGGKANG